MFVPQCLYVRPSESPKTATVPGIPNSPDGGVGTVSDHPLHPRVDAPVPEVDVVLPVVVPPDLPAPCSPVQARIQLILISENP